MTSIQEQLKEHLRNGEDWEKMETPVPGVYIVKVPKSKAHPARLNIEINPLREDGTPFKRSGLFIGNKETLIKFAEVMSDDKAYQLMQILDYVNARKNAPIDEILGVSENNEDYEESISTELEEDDMDIEEDNQPSEITDDDNSLEQEIDISEEEEDEEDAFEEELSKSSESVEKSNRLYVDIANLLYSNKDNQGNLKVENIGPIYDNLKLRGFNPIFIADASIL
jgi:hypothetical protein